MTSHTIIHASDLHLGDAAGGDRAHAASTAWSRFAEAVADLQPDLVLLSGDLIVDDPDDMIDQHAAHKLISSLGVPTAVVPGNHDVGDHAVRSGLPADWHGKLVSEQRITRWEAIWGPSYWLRTIGDWDILGLNSQLFGSGLKREAEQWRWLEQTALPTPGDRPFLLVAHEPLDVRLDADDADNWMSIPTESSVRLVELLRNRRLAAACSGHTHRFLDWNRNGLRNITAPSLAGPIPVRNDMSQVTGDPSPGWLTYTLDATGGMTVEHHTLSHRLA